MDKSSIYRALIVDDEAPVRQLTLRALAIEGFQCQTAMDGNEAQQLLQESMYDVVVTDLKMPNRNGHLLVTDLMQQQNRPAIVVLTGILEPSLVKDLILRGVEQIELKPIDCTMFGAKVKALVTRYHAHALDRSAADCLAQRAEGSMSSSRGMDTSVSRVMSREVHTTTPVATMGDIAKQMSITGVRHLPVVNYKRELVGIITQRDLFRQVGQVGNATKCEIRGQVGEFMSKTLEFVSPTTPLAEAAEKMLSKKLGCLPVLAEGREVIGILTRSDLLRHFIGTQRTEATESQAV